MTTIGKFEDLNVWKESMRLSIDVYKELRTCKDFALKDQVQRSSVSIPSNIAEGYERDSNKEFIRFLYIAKASCGELRTQLYISQAVEIIEKQIAEILIERTRKISAMLHNYIKVRKEQFS